MTRYSHLWLGGLVAFAIWHSNPHSNGIYPIAFTFGSVAPDFDVKLFGLTNKPFRERTLFEHRGIFHHVLMPVFLLIAVFLVGFTDMPKEVQTAMYYFTGGYALHLLTDAFSLTGIPYWTYQDRVRFKLYRTGDVTEALVVIAFSFIVLAFLYLAPAKTHAKTAQHPAPKTQHQDKILYSAWQKWLKLKDKYDNKSKEKVAEELGLSYSQVEKAIHNKKGIQAAQKSYNFYKQHIYDKQITPYIRSLGSKYNLFTPSNQILSRDERIYIFMSSSVPKVVWEKYALAIDKLRRQGQGNIGIILRGCINGCHKVMPTIRFIYSIITCCGKKLKVPIEIDPLLFKLYNIKRVPTFVFAKGVKLKDPTLSAGLVYNLKNKNITAYRVSGDCPFSWALKRLFEESGDGKMLQLYNLLNRSWFEQGAR